MWKLSSFYSLCWTPGLHCMSNIFQSLAQVYLSVLQVCPSVLLYTSMCHLLKCTCSVPEYTSVYFSVPAAYLSIPQWTSVYLSITQCTWVYLSVLQCTSSGVPVWVRCIRRRLSQWEGGAISLCRLKAKTFLCISHFFKLDKSIMFRADFWFLQKIFKFSNESFYFNLSFQIFVLWIALPSPNSRFQNFHLNKNVIFSICLSDFLKWWIW